MLHRSDAWLAVTMVSMDLESSIRAAPGGLAVILRKHGKAGHRAGRPLEQQG
jgi:hypothetical protein